MVDKSEDKLLARHSLLSAVALAKVDGDGGRNSALQLLTFLQEPRFTLDSGSEVISPPSQSSPLKGEEE